MNVKELMYDAFSTVTVQDDKLLFLQNYSEEELKLIYDKFSRDLLDYKIPHYRVIGILFMPGLSDSDSMVRITPYYGMSKINVMREAQKLIPIKLDGNDKSKFCYLDVDEERPTVGFGWDDPSRVLNIFTKRPSKKDPSVIIGGRDQIGQLRHYQGIAGNEMSAKTILFHQRRADAMESPRYLFPNHKVLDLPGRKDVLLDTYFFYIKGTGYLDFKQTQAYFSHNSGVTGCRTKFDLSEFFTCRIPMSGGNSLTLTIFEEFDEGALTQILRDYGKGFGE